MKLKRPVEKKWNWKTPPEPFPQTPGANGAMISPSGGGKSTSLISMLLGPYSKVFDEVHVFSPSVDIDSAWEPVRHFAKGLKASSFHSEWDEAALREIMAKQKQKVKELKDANSKKPLPQCLTIIDDFADRPDIMHAAGNILTTLFIRGRHFGSSCWLSSQKLTAISTVARVNFRFMLVWRLRNQREVMALMEELSAVYPIPVLHNMYETALSDEDHSFWYINLVAKQKQDMFHIRFEHKMILEEEED
jgi:hypothetical protein